LSSSTSFGRIAAGLGENVSWHYLTESAVPSSRTEDRSASPAASAIAPRTRHADLFDAGIVTPACNWHHASVTADDGRAPRARGAALRLRSAPLSLHRNEQPAATDDAGASSDRAGPGSPVVRAPFGGSRAVAGLNALAKGRRLDLYSETSEEDRKRRARAREKAGVTWVELLGRRVAVVDTPKGLRAVRDRTPQDPAAVERYLEGKLGDSLAAVRAAMTALARSIPRRELSGRAFALYEEFRPSVPSGERGWGSRGDLDIGRVRALARKGSPARPRPRKPAQ
jgi:hypothetical protein